MDQVESHEEVPTFIFPALETRSKTLKENLGAHIHNDSLCPGPSLTWLQGDAVDLGARSVGNSGLGTVYLAFIMCLGVGVICDLKKRKPKFQGGPVTCSMSKEQSRDIP